jgi:hypothetical protein
MVQKDNRERSAGEADLEFVEPCPCYAVDGWDAVFDWCYRIGRANLETLVRLAAHLGVSPQTLYNKYSEYKAQYGAQPMHR